MGQPIREALRRLLAGLPGAEGSLSDETSGPAGSAGDARCPSCGYDRKGLSPGAACPECGRRPGGAAKAPAPATAAVPPGPRDPRFGPKHVRSTADDPLLALIPADRSHVRLGARLAILAVVGSVVETLATLGTSISAAVSGGLLDDGALFASAGARLVLAGLFTAAAGMMARGPVWTAARPVPPGLRIPVLAGLFAWPLAYGCLIAAIEVGGGTPDPALFAVTRALQVIAGLAALTVVLVLARVALAAELEVVERRLLTTLFVLPVFAGLRLVFAGTMTWVGLILLFVLVIIPWTWMMLRAALAFHGIATHLGWVERGEDAADGRAERVAARRAEIDAATRAKVRRGPGSSGTGRS